MSTSAVVETAKTANASSRADKQPVEEGYSAAVDTADRASAIMSSTVKASAATDFSGVENLLAVCLIKEII